MISPIILNILQLGILIFSIMLHEFMHGLVAFRCGDPTARDAGRLSFNPLVHIDPIGSVGLPLLLMVTNSPFLIGWAKPVPVNPGYFRHYKRDNALTSFAGPFSNICLGIVLIILLVLVTFFLRLGQYSTINFSSPFEHVYVLGHTFEATALTYLLNVIQYGVIINFVLATFNLIPIPPLDGSHILMAIVPDEWVRKIFVPLSQYGMIIIIVLVATGFLSFILVPVIIAVHIVFAIIAAVMGLG